MFLNHTLIKKLTGYFVNKNQQLFGFDNYYINQICSHLYPLYQKIDNRFN